MFLFCLKHLLLLLAVHRHLDKRIYIPLPDKIARETMFKIHIGNTPNDLKPSHFKELANLSEG
jgi:vacuolar protein-sorting-associated protein 4